MPFVVCTDHKPLKNIPSSIQMEADATGRRGRWAVELSSYDFAIEIRPGRCHGNADALSRRPGNDVGHNLHGNISDIRSEKVENPSKNNIGEGLVDSTTDAALICQERDTDSKRGVKGSETDENAREYNVSFVKTDWEAEQRKDELLSEVRRWIGDKKGRRIKSSGGDNWKHRLYARNIDHIQIVDGVLGMTRKHNNETGFRILVPEGMKEEVLHSLHDHVFAGHMGYRRTIDRVMRRFYWPGAYAEVRDYCRSCELCQRRQRPAPAARAPLQTETVNHPFERVAMDITEMPQSSRGNRYALVIMDYFSKYVKVYPMADQKAETVAECLLMWVYDHGVPERLHSDQGRQFEAAVFQELCRRLGIEKTRTTPYHPESDGMVERFMRTLKDMVSKFIEPRGSDWDLEVRPIAMAYNSAKHDTTQFSPYFLVHGQEPRLPADATLCPSAPLDQVRSFLEDRAKALQGAFQTVRRNSEVAARATKERFDERQNMAHYSKGDKVWVSDPTAEAGGKPKLGLPYKGPATVIRSYGPKGQEVVHKVQGENGKATNVHHNRLKPVYFSRIFRRQPQYEVRQGPTPPVRIPGSLVADDATSAPDGSPSEVYYQSWGVHQIHIMHTNRIQMAIAAGPVWRTSLG